MLSAAVSIFFWVNIRIFRPSTPSLSPRSSTREKTPRASRSRASEEATNVCPDVPRPNKYRVNGLIVLVTPIGFLQEHLGVRSMDASTRWLGYNHCSWILRLNSSVIRWLHLVLVCLSLALYAHNYHPVKFLPVAFGSVIDTAFIMATRYLPRVQTLSEWIHPRGSTPLHGHKVQA